MNEIVEKVKEIVSKSDNIVFFGGAGMSTESGIPDFRSDTGIYRKEFKFPPEHILSLSFFQQHSDVFYEFYRERSLQYMLNAKPNAGHIKLAEWEKQEKLKAVITQNIDGLHQMAGSKNVLELHGSTNKNYCMKCGKFFDMKYMASTTGIAYCNVCGGMIHPGGVLFEETLDSQTLEKSIHYIKQADMLIVGGTSAVVYPAAGLIHYYKGNKLIVINKDTSVNDSRADYMLHGMAGEILSQL